MQLCLCTKVKLSLLQLLNLRTLYIYFNYSSFQFLAHPQPMRFIHGRRCMIAQHLQCDTLLGHSHNSLLVHVRVVYAHAAENGESFDEILIVFGKVLKLTEICDLWNGETQKSIFFILLTKSSNLFINCITPIIWPSEFFIAIHRMDLCLKLPSASTLPSKRSSS